MKNNIVKIRLRSWSNDYYMTAKEIKYFNHRGVEKTIYETISRHSPGINIEWVGYTYNPVDIVLID